MLARQDNYRRRLIARLAACAVAVAASGKVAAAEPPRQPASINLSASPVIIQRSPLPRGLNPILALAISPDDELVACNRGEQLFVYDVRGPRLAATLADPAFARDGRPDVAHLDLIRSLAFDRSGNWLASGGFRTVKLWRRPRTTLEKSIASQQPIRSFAVSSDGSRLAVGAESGAIELHALGGNDPPKTLPGHTNAVTGLAFSADGSRLFSASLDRSVRAWGVAHGEPGGRLATLAEARSLVLLPGSDQLATAEADNVVRIWKISNIVTDSAAGESPAPARELKGLNRPAVSLATAPELADRLLSGDEEGRLRMWNTATGEVIRDFGHEAPITAVAIRPDGARVISVGANGVGRLWNPADGALVSEFKLDERAVRALAKADAAVFYAKACVEYRKEEQREADEALKRETAVVEGAHKAREMADKTVMEKTEIVKKAVEERSAAEAKATEAATAFKDAGAKRTAAQTAVDDAEATLKKAAVAAEAAKSAADKEKENKDLQAASAAAEKDLADVRTRKQAAEAALATATQGLREAQQKSQAADQAKYEPTQKAKNLERELQEAKNVAQGAVNFIATATAVLERAKGAVPTVQQAVTEAEAAVTRREVEKKALADAAQMPRKPLQAVAFSPDGSRVALAGAGPGISVLDADRGTPVEFLEQQDSTVQTLAFSADGRLWSAESNQKVVSWTSAADWTLERTIGRLDDPGQLTDRVLSVDFHPDSKLLATGGGRAADSGELKLWSTADGTLVRDFAGAHRDTFNCVRFSPDGQYLATASADRLVKVFRVADGSLVHTLAGHTHHVLGVCWQPDGKRLASCGGDNVVKLWDMEAETALRTMRGDTYLIGEYKREVNTISFIGDTEHLLVSSGDRTVRMHRTSNPRDVRCFREGRSFMHAAVCTSDGKLVFGGGRDGVLHLWNGESGYPILSFRADDPATPVKAQ